MASQSKNGTPGTSGQEPSHRLRSRIGSGKTSAGQQEEKSLMGQQVEESQKKRGKTSPGTSDLNTYTEEVEIESKHNSEGYVWSGNFTSKNKSQSMRDIIDYIGKEEKILMKSDEYVLYPAFKEALSRILTTIDKVLTSENDSVRIILVHGGPNIGKSALAKCLALLLSLSTGKEAVHLIKLCHSERIDDRVLTGCITDDCSKKYLIVDQVNTNSLNRVEILKYVKTKMMCKSKMPLVMFTSGHYAPSEEWTNGLICYKVIAMQVDDAVVSKLRESRALAKDAISNDKLLKVTTFFPRIIKCLDHLEYDKPEAGEDDLRKVIYPGADSALIKEKSMAHFIFLVWGKFIENGVKPSELTDDDLKMEPGEVHYLGYLISGIKDARDRGINAILNSIEIMGNAEYTKNGYTEFNCSSYYYTWSYKETLCDVLLCARETHKDVLSSDIHKLLLPPFLNKSLEVNSHFQLVRGHLFEMIIETYCDKEAERNQNAVGIRNVDGHLQVVDVDHSVKAATVSELCKIPNQTKSGDKVASSFWCVLNENKRPEFPGFDFAFMQTRRNKNITVVEILQLFQVTVNAKGKKPKQLVTMAKVINEINENLEKNKFISKNADNVLCPYFVQPSPLTDTIAIPKYKSSKSINVDVIGIPPKVLKMV